jgi:hypothetical protein
MLEPLGRAVATPQASTLAATRQATFETWDFDRVLMGSLQPPGVSHGSRSFEIDARRAGGRRAPATALSRHDLTDPASARHRFWRRRDRTSESAFATPSAAGRVRGTIGAIW